MATKQRRQVNTPVAPPKRRRTSTNPKMEEVVYTQPKPFQRNRFLIHLASVVAVVLALVFGMSIFFKVGQVTVSGMEKYTAWDVKEASGIQEGETLLTLSKATISGKIITKLPYVGSVRVGIKLPDTVNIEVKELDVVYAIAGDDGNWWLMTASGRLVEPITEGVAKTHTQVLGVQITGAEVGMQAVALEAVPDETEATDATEQTQAPAVTILGRERLEQAITILQHLEDNGVVGEVASVDVSDTEAMELWYGQRYLVQLGDGTQMNRKIKSMKAAVDQMGEYQSGELDVSFTIWPQEVGYTPFE